MTTRFIVVDGLDGCGKDSHAIRIRRKLEERGEKVEVISHPSGRLFGRLSKRALQGSGAAHRLVATVFFTADVLCSVHRMKRERAADTMIFVRYLLGAAYLPERLAPMGYAFFRRILPFPDLALFIDIHPEVALRRIASRGHRTEMFETKERLERVRHVARALASAEWVTVDNSEDGDAPFAVTERIVTERFDGVKR